MVQLTVVGPVSGPNVRPLVWGMTVDLSGQGSDPDDVRRNVQRRVEAMVDELFARLRARGSDGG